MAKSYPDLWIIRHGQTRWNLEGRFQGSMDSPLTDLGRDQARRVGEILAAESLPKVATAWTSPQGRAQATAGIALAGCFADWTTDDRLAEIRVGEAEGVIAEDFFAAGPDLAAMEGAFNWQFCVPGGESYSDFQGRIESWLDQLSAPAVVVTHGITSRVMRCIVLGLGRGGMDELPGGQGVVHRVRGQSAEVLR